MRADEQSAVGLAKMHNKRSPGHRDLLGRVEIRMIARTRKGRGRGILERKEGGRHTYRGNITPTLMHSLRLG